MSQPNDAVPAPGTPAAWRKWLPRIYKGFGIGVGVCLAAALAESFASLVVYFLHQSVPWPLALIAPLTVDVFTVAGEVFVLIAVVNRWEQRYKVAGWCAAAAGLAVSVAGNVGKDGWRIPPERAASFAIAPMAVAGLLALGLAIIKRELHPPALPGATSALPEPLVTGLRHFPGALNGGGIPAVGDIKKAVGCGQPKAQSIRDYLTALRADLDAVNGSPQP
jgi:hypothetical protein